MPSTLGLQLSGYQSQTAWFLGWGMTVPGPNWTSDQVQQITSPQGFVASGIRRFYKPSPFYEWSFLKPFVTLTLIQGTNTVPLPEDFAGITGSLTVSADALAAPNPVRLFNPAQIDQRFAAYPLAVGVPQMAGVRALKGTTQLNGSTQELSFFPLADQNYSVTFAYSIFPHFLDGTHPYVYGGAEHSETILCSCLAIAEERANDSPGPQALAFQRELSSSIESDRRKKPQMFGRSRDRSDDFPTGFDGYLPNYDAAGITINGINYD